MPRPQATSDSEARVRRLVVVLLGSVVRGDETVAEVSKNAGLGHETVRQLLRNPAGRQRYGPGFFIVAALARSQGLSLDAVAAQVEWA